MKDPTLVILAAGMGSRFGGLKQITAVDEFGHAIIDFSLYDAYRAGFRKVAFIIKHEIEDSFKEFIGRRVEKYFDVKYVYQQLDMLPEGFTVPSERVKPWGTGHAVLCAKNAIDGPFAVINADDYYGANAYKAIFDYLSSCETAGCHCMVGYNLKNTVTANGHVARGICSIENGYLSDIVERTHIEKDGDNAKYTEDGENWFSLPGDTVVSMNYWGFTEDFMERLEAFFPEWLRDTMPSNPLKAEFFLPFAVDRVINEGSGSVKILNCRDVWHGVTYQNDLPDVKAAIAELRADGLYPDFMLD